LDGALFAGSLPVSKVRLVQAWIEIHRESLMLFPFDLLR
jgi:hypothetical protein